MILIPCSRWCIKLLCITCFTWFALMIVISDAAVISPNSPSFRENLLEKRVHQNLHELDPIGSKIFYIAGIATSSANMIGSTIMIYLTIRKNRHNSELLTPSKRFPLYMAIMDLGTSVVTLPNLLYPMEKDYLMEESWCTSLGIMTSILIIMNMMLMASLALITYLRICKQHDVNLGKKDWILFVSILFPTLTISFVTWLFDGFGPDTYWCFMNQATNGSRVNLIALTMFSYIVTIITTFCYMSVINRIHNVEIMLTAMLTRNSKNDPVSRFSKFKKSPQKISPDKFSSLPKLKPKLSSASTTSASSVDGLEVRPPSFFYGPRTSKNGITAAQKRAVKNIAIATRKMSSYIFLQLLQYTPIIIYSLCFLMKQMQTWVYVLTIVMLNLGGVTKSLTFMKNEILCNSKERKSGRTIDKCKGSLNEKSFESGTLNSNETNSCDENNGNVPFISISVQQGFAVDYFSNDNDNLENRNSISSDVTVTPAGQELNY